MVDGGWWIARLDAEIFLGVLCDYDSGFCYVWGFTEYLVDIILRSVTSGCFLCICIGKQRFAHDNTEYAFIE